MCFAVFLLAVANPILLLHFAVLSLSTLPPTLRLPIHPRSRSTLPIHAPNLRTNPRLPLLSLLLTRHETKAKNRAFSDMSVT